MAHGPGYSEHPEHSVILRPTPDHVRVVVGGKRVAQSDHAIVVEEAGHDPVLYIPREDVDMAALKPKEGRTHCPYKGEAVTFSVNVGSDVREDAAWSYVSPYDETRSIGDYVAFDAKRVDKVEVTPHVGHPQASG